jgi:hypothetical protein
VDLSSNAPRSPIIQSLTTLRAAHVYINHMPHVYCVAPNNESRRPNVTNLLRSPKAVFFTAPSSALVEPGVEDLESAGGENPPNNDGLSPSPPTLPVTNNPGSDGLPDTGAVSCAALGSMSKLDKKDVFSSSGCVDVMVKKRSIRELCSARGVPFKSRIWEIIHSSHSPSKTSEPTFWKFWYDISPIRTM